MAEIIARFADGRLLVQEDRAVEQDYLSGGVKVRIGHVKTVEKVLSIDNWVSGYYGDKVMTHIRDVSISGDTLLVLMRRADFGVPSMTATGTAVISGGVGIFSGYVASGFYSGVLSGYGYPLSGYVNLINISGAITVTTTPSIGSGAAALGVLSAITSGLYQYQELTSGRPISGVLRILANVIGF